MKIREKTSFSINSEYGVHPKDKKVGHLHSFLSFWDDSTLFVPLGSACWGLRFACQKLAHCTVLCQQRAVRGNTIIVAVFIYATETKRKYFGLVGFTTPNQINREGRTVFLSRYLHLGAGKELICMGIGYIFLTLCVWAGMWFIVSLTEDSSGRVFMGRTALCLHNCVHTKLTNHTSTRNLFNRI